MVHSYSSEVAKEVGIIPAVIFWDLSYWIRHNEENKVCFKEGRYWTFNSSQAFQQRHPYLTVKQIRHALNVLSEKDFICKSNFNKNKFNRTLWYAIGDVGALFYSVMFTEVKVKEMHLPCRENGADREGKSERYNNVKINKLKYTNVHSNSIRKENNKREELNKNIQIDIHSFDDLTDVGRDNIPRACACTRAYEGDEEVEDIWKYEDDIPEEFR